MAEAADEGFYARADAHIRLSNDQLNEIDRGKVGASMMYATARFNAYINACACGYREEMIKRRDETIEYFVKSYRQMFEENFDDYAESFESYMRKSPD